MALVQASCLSGVTGFGIGSNEDEDSGMTALVSITCTRSTPWSVLIDAGRQCGAAAITGDPTDAQFTVVYSPFPDVAGALGSLEPMIPGSIFGMGTSTAQLLTIHFGAAGGQRAEPSTGSAAIVAEITY
jgi:spore coat protein U-like protein